MVPSLVCMSFFSHLCIFFLFVPFLSRTLYIFLLVCLARKGAEELIRKM